MRKHVRKVQALSASALVLAAAAVPAAANEPAISRWVGPYVGAHAGYGWGTTDFSTSCDAEAGCWDFGAIGSNGFVGGFLAGYNFAATNDVIIGLETDFSFSSIDGDEFFSGKNASTEAEFLATIRARLGWLLTQDVMVYATAGLAIADLTHEFTTPFEEVRYSFSDIEFGFVVGGGFESLLSDSLKFRIEYLYYDFGSTSHNVEFLGLTGKARFDDQFHTVRAALIFKLD